MLRFDWTFDAFGHYKSPRPGTSMSFHRFGLSLDVVGEDECPYLRRLILWLGPLGTLRLHRFYRSDHDRALHDHPWWFVTFPLATYHEWVPLPEGLFICPEFYGNVLVAEGDRFLNTVQGWRFHFRPAEYRHAVVIDRPMWTLVLTGPKERSWGFWDRIRGFVHWRAWGAENPPAPCSELEEAR